MYLQRLLPFIFGIGIVGLYYISTPLFAIVVAFALTYLMFRRKVEPEEDEQPTEPSGRLLDAARGFTGLRFHGEVAGTRQDGFPLRIAIQEAPSSHGGRIEVIALSAKVTFPIPFCFTIRRPKSPIQFSKLVANTPIPPVQFEYELKRVEFGDSVLEASLECAANFPGQMKRLLASELLPALHEMGSSHSHRLEEIAFTGSEVVMQILPAGNVDEEGSFPFAWEFALPLVRAVHAFVVGNLHESTAPPS